MKVVINKCFGGFSLSYAAVMAYAKRKGIKLYAYTQARTEEGRFDFDKYVSYNGTGEAFIVHYSTLERLPNGKIPDGGYFSDRDVKRDDPDLCAVVKRLGAMANGDCAKLAIIEIPDEIKWGIHEYDGLESVEEEHRSWS